MTKTNFENALDAVEQAGADEAETDQRRGVWEELMAEVGDVELDDLSLYQVTHAASRDDNTSARGGDISTGFCAGCGAHEVRAAGKMLCVECYDAFNDIG